MATNAVLKFLLNFLLKLSLHCMPVLSVILIYSTFFFVVSMKSKLAILFNSWGSVGFKFCLSAKCNRNYSGQAWEGRCRYHHEQAQPERTACSHGVSFYQKICRYLKERQVNTNRFQRSKSNKFYLQNYFLFWEIRTVHGNSIYYYTLVDGGWLGKLIAVTNTFCFF